MALCQAESGLDPKAPRYGVWPDVSFGLTQVTVATAAGYGVGDGTASADNIANVRAALYSRPVALDVGARILADALIDSGGNWLWGLIVYNAGWLPPPGDPWYDRWASNVATYERALAWARETVG